MNFFKRLEGVFVSPKPTFGALAEKPVWVDVLVVLLIAMAVYSLAVMPYMRAEQYQMMKDSAKLKEKMGEGPFNGYVQKFAAPPTTWDYVNSTAIGPAFVFVGLLLQASVLMLLGRFVSSLGTFKQVLSALLVNIVFGNAVRLVLAVTRKSIMQVSTGLGMFFPKMEVTSTAYIVLGQVDFFQLWMFGILAFGLSAAFKVSIRKALFISYTLWFLKALANIGMTLFGMSFLR
jgi:Yip1 domain